MKFLYSRIGMKWRWVRIFNTLKSRRREIRKAWKMMIRNPITTNDAHPGMASGVSNLMAVVIIMPVMARLIRVKVAIRILTASMSVYTDTALRPWMMRLMKFIFHWMI